MKCLLVVPRWNELESLMPFSGRPHLDLTLQQLGVNQLDVVEVDPDDPFDPFETDPEYRLILVEGERGSRLRRSVLSNLDIMLWVDDSSSDRLRVGGGRPLLNSLGEAVGFVINRQNRLVALCEEPIWNDQDGLKQLLDALLYDGANLRSTRFNCWMVEDGVDLKPSDIWDTAPSMYGRLRYLPDGDAAVVFPANTNAELAIRTREQLGDRLYSEHPVAIESLLQKQLTDANMTIAVAESCTAGLVMARLSALPGSSAYLKGGYVTYSNDLKMDLNPGIGALITACGAVSSEVAMAMANGARRKSEADMAVAITGIAGPGGGSAEKPVGTVYLAAVHINGNVLEEKKLYRGSRDRVRFQASQTALHMLRRLL
ncbi:MAG: nicotinamide-nucleotide amidohydrolase family protein [Magnetococcales bacterium]|nr:nicotinamide-nucleotide amidohydrolase family protein [Magnetococcales bacterium]